MNQDAKLDQMVKQTLQADLINLLGIRPYKRGKKNQFETTTTTLREDNKKMFTPVSALRNLTIENYAEILRPEDYVILFETDEEFNRRGNFVRAFPTIDRILRFSGLFEVERNNNILVWKWMELMQSGTNILESIINESYKYLEK